MRTPPYGTRTVRACASRARSRASRRARSGPVLGTRASPGRCLVFSVYQYSARSLRKTSACRTTTVPSSVTRSALAEAGAAQASPPQPTAAATTSKRMRRRVLTRGPPSLFSQRAGIPSMRDASQRGGVRDLVGFRLAHLLDRRARPLVHARDGARRFPGSAWSTGTSADSNSSRSCTTARDSSSFWRSSAAGSGSAAAVSAPELAVESAACRGDSADDYERPGLHETDATLARLPAPLRAVPPERRRPGGADQTEGS